jgi:hypothetical protein
MRVKRAKKNEVLREVCKKKKMKDTREARKKIGRNFGLHTPA